MYTAGVNFQLDGMGQYALNLGVIKFISAIFSEKAECRSRMELPRIRPETAKYCGHFGFFQCILMYFELVWWTILGFISVINVLSILCMQKSVVAMTI